MTKEVPDPHAPRQDENYWEALFDDEDAESSAAPPAAVGSEDIWSTLTPLTKKRSPHPLNSLPQENGRNPWLIAREYYQNDKPIEATVDGYNKGGLLIHWHGLQGFIPASQLVDFPQFHIESERLRALKQWVDQSLTLKIIELNPKSNRLILSERSALVEADERDDLLDRIDPGAHVRGEVTNLTRFGAFVDLGGVEGLIHISELSWSRVAHPSDVVQPGDQVKVEVLTVDEQKGRIALSLKRLKEDPWLTVNERFQPGQLVEGVVSKVVSFGAFVQIEDELEGLVHVSELAEGSFLHPRNVVEIGQPVVARVMQVNGLKKRLALTMRGIAQS